MADPIKMGDLWAAFGKPKAPLDMFGTLESQYGLPRGYLGQTYQIESGGNPYAQNPNSSAGGGFQFIDSTARQYGLTDKSNLGASADAAARLARDNAAQLRRVLGREPTAAELYLAHQQGGGGASALLANPNAPAVDIVGADAVRLNGGNANMTAGEFANLWLGKFGNTPMPMNTGGGGMAGGNVTMSTMGGQQEQSPSIWNNLFGGALADPDKRARLAIALEGMTLNPNQALIQTQAEGIKSRADEKKAATEINRTAAWLRSQGRDDLAAAVESGALGGRDAAGIAMQPAPVPEAIQPQSAAGKLEADYRAGLITPEAYKAGIASLAPSGTAISIGPNGEVMFEQGTGVQAKPFTEAQGKDVVYSTRARGALEALEPVANALTSRTARAAEYDPTGLARGAVQSDEYQVAKNAGDEFLQAILRKDTGAAITSQEQALYGETYLPQPGDNEALLAQKKAARQRAIVALEAGMSPSMIVAQEKALGKGATATVPAGVDPEDWAVMTPEEKAAFQ